MKTSEYLTSLIFKCLLTPAWCSLAPITRKLTCSTCRGESTQRSMWGIWTSEASTVDTSEITRIGDSSALCHPVKSLSSRSFHSLKRATHKEGHPRGAKAATLRCPAARKAQIKATIALLQRSHSSRPSRRQTWHQLTIYLKGYPWARSIRKRIHLQWLSTTACLYIRKSENQIIDKIVDSRQIDIVLTCKSKRSLACLNKCELIEWSKILFN